MNVFVPYSEGKTPLWHAAESLPWREERQGMRAEIRARVKSLCFVILLFWSRLTSKGPAVSSQEPLSRRKSHLH